MKPWLFRVTTFVVLASTLFGCFDSATVPGRTDGAVFCAPVKNPCVTPTAPVDLNSDACADRCEAPTCESFAPVVCRGGAMPVDLDGDGCARECPPATPTLCGGIAGIACSTSDYCDFPAAASCGAGDQSGTCLPRPEVCNDLYAPVCGCDAVTYANECDAHAKGASIAHWGRCTSDCLPIAIDCAIGTHLADTNGDGCVDGCVPDARSCGGLVPPGVENTCASTEYCDYSLSAICGAADATGVCKPKPQACTADVHPVCGCDGKTYSNECVAHANGTGLLHYGTCDVVCPAFYPLCPSGQVPVDANQDGCIDGCGAPI